MKLFLLCKEASCCSEPADAKPGLCCCCCCRTWANASSRPHTPQSMLPPSLPNTLLLFSRAAMLPARSKVSLAADGAAKIIYSKIPSFDQIDWPEEFPFADPKYFQRQDESLDAVFYDSPRYVTHIDDGAIEAISKYYAATVPSKGSTLLDLCSSWISHLPESHEFERVAVLGMNEAELGRNRRATERVVQDLNINPTLPFADDSFDTVTNVVSVDYLTKPLEIFREMHRVLKPGGTAIMSFSNRCFPTKAVGIWGQTDDAGHIWVVGSYFRYSTGWRDVKAFDISEGRGSDPMFVVQGTK